MPTVNLNKGVFEKLVGKELPLDELKDRISMLGTDLEGIEGDEIVVEVFPNRPDMLSEQGFARAFSSFIGEKTGLREYEVKDSKEKVVVDSSLKNIRPYTVCAIIKNLKLDDEKIREIMQVQEKLHVTHLRRRKKGAIGIYPMEKISFPITFKAEKPNAIEFAPLEAEKMPADRILEEHPAGKEYGHLLEGYSAYPIFEDNNGDILSMPPIVNSHKTGKVTEDTKEVFIECSGFDMKVLEKCLNIIVTALADMGGELHSMRLEYPDFNKTTPNLTPEKMKVDIDYVNKRLGLELGEDEIKDCLEKMGYGYEDCCALVPAYRADILHMVDLVEDIAIAYGYENFEEELPQCATIGEEDGFERFKNKVAHMLAGLGIIETYTYNITNEDFQSKRMNFDAKLIKLRNALSNEHNTLRAWVVPSLMEILSRNRHNEYPQNIFTFGDVFKKNEKTETGVKEDVRLGVVLCSEEAGYTEIKQVLDNILTHIGIDYKCEEAEHGSFIPGRCARGYINNKGVAYLGEVHPLVLENWGLSFPVAALELNLTDVYSMLKEGI
ncbi:MAG: phenylalanine--tRNA ligase subunit beta [Candidatus Nanoarchaeia archaeon]